MTKHGPARSEHKRGTVAARSTCVRDGRRYTTTAPANAEGRFFGSHGDAGLSGVTPAVFSGGET